MSASQPPETYLAFRKEFPQLAQAWDLTQRAGESGPLTPREQRLVKLALAMGAFREGAVRASVRKASDVGIAPDEIHQMIQLAAPLLGFPSTVALVGWVKSVNDDA